MVCRSGGAFAKDYPEIKLGIIYPFQGFGENWNEANQQMLQRVQMSADYVNATSHQPYKEPSQLRNHTQFLLNTQMVRCCFMMKNSLENQLFERCEEISGGSSLRDRSNYNG